jgi:hypothetical protein
MGLKTQWCPHCKENAYQEDAGFPLDPDVKQTWMQRLGFEDSFARLFPGLSAAGYLRYRRCIHCRELWGSVELPALLLHDVFIACHEARHEAARNACTIIDYQNAIREVRNELRRLSLLDEPDPTELQQQLEAVAERMENALSCE